MKTREIPISKIVVAGNVRIDEDEELSGLMASIEEHGLLQPVIVRHKTLETFEIVAGHRRLAAMKMLGEKKIPAIVNDEITAENRMIIQIVENAQRKQMSAVEYVECFQALKKQRKGLSNAAIGRMLGRTGGWVQHQYDAVKLTGALVDTGERPAALKEMTAGQIISRAQKKGVGVKGPRVTSDISVSAINSTTLNVRCRDAAVLARVLEWIDALREQIRKEEDVDAS